MFTSANPLLMLSPTTFMLSPANSLLHLVIGLTLHGRVKAGDGGGPTQVLTQGVRNVS